MANITRRSRKGKKPDSTTQKVTKTLKKVNKAIAFLHHTIDVLGKPKVLRTYASFKEYILINAPSDQTDSHLCRLPAELMISVFQNLREDYDRASLAIACKKTASVFQTMQDRAPRPFQSHPSTRLMILTQLLGSMPPEYRLCVCCMRFRKQDGKTQAQWFGDSQVEKALKAVVEDPLRTQKAARVMKLRETGLHCPTCTERKNIQAVEDELVCRNKLTQMRRTLQHEIKSHRGTAKGRMPADTPVTIDRHIADNEDELSE